MKHLAWYAHHVSVFRETPLSEGAISEYINSLAGLGSLACSCVQLKVTDIAKCIYHLETKATHILLNEQQQQKQKQQPNQTKQTYKHKNPAQPTKKTTHKKSPHQTLEAPPQKNQRSQQALLGTCRKRHPPK